MKKRAFLTVVPMLVLLLALVNCGKKTFELQSIAFKNNERIPDKYCHGNAEGRQNISLPFIDPAIIV